MDVQGFSLTARKSNLCVIGRLWLGGRADRHFDSQVPDEQFGTLSVYERVCVNVVNVGI